MSPYNDISQRLAALAEQVNGYVGLVSVPFPGKGVTVDAANAKREAMAQHLGALAEWLQTAAGTASTQATYDKGLEAAPSPEDIKALREACYESGNDPNVVQELKDAMREKADAQQRHDGDTSGTNWGDQPAAPAGCPVPGAESSNGDPNGDDGDGTGGGLGDLGGDRTEDPDVRGAEDTPEPGDTGFTGQPADAASAPIEQARPASSPSLSADSVGTETSADTATLPPTTGAGALGAQPTQATPGGAPIQGTGGAPNAAFGPTGGVPGALGQPPQGSRGGTPPQSPEKRREAADKQAERDAVTDAAAGTVGGAAAGVAAGGILTPSTPSAPPTNVSGAQGVTTPTGTPPPASTPPNTGVAGGVGGGGVRPPNPAMGSGEQVSGNNMKPIYRADDPEWKRELDAMLGIDPDEDNSDNDDEGKK